MLAKADRMTHLQESILTLDELSDYLKISKSSLYKLVQAGKIPGSKVGKHWRFRRQTIERWLDSAHETLESKSVGSSMNTGANGDLGKGRAFKT